MTSPESFSTNSGSHDNVFDIAARRKQKAEAAKPAEGAVVQDSQEHAEALALQEAMVHSEEPQLSYSGPFLKESQAPTTDFVLNGDEPNFHYPEGEEPRAA